MHVQYFSRVLGPSTCKRQAMVIEDASKVNDGWVGFSKGSNLKSSGK